MQTGWPSFARLACGAVAGDEFLITGALRAPGWAALARRQEVRDGDWPSLSEARLARRGLRVEGPWLAGLKTPGPWTCTSRTAGVACARPRRSCRWRVRAGTGSWTRWGRVWWHWRRQVREVVREINQVADYARRFNRHVAEAAGEEDAPKVRVAVCYACFVLDGGSQEVACSGDTVVLTSFYGPEVSKFVFEGNEEFQELPQALLVRGGQQLRDLELFSGDVEDFSSDFR